MDSLTQIVLGAACGEAVAGKKMGNRALLWGAIGGTIPDLDVLANLLVGTMRIDEMDALAFHRGFMHSFLFAFLAPFPLAWLIKKFYDSGFHQKHGYKLGLTLAVLLCYAAITVGINAVPKILFGTLNGPTLAISVLLFSFLGWRMWARFYRKDSSDVAVDYKTWWLVLFWSIFTHPILDCFTGFGTQIFQPFSDWRIQWTTVSVVDPIYTIPFAIALIVLSRWQKNDRRRAIFNWAGIIWSTGYLAFTVYHKMEVNRIFEQNFQAQNIPYQRFMTGPTIFNNVLWYGVAESDTAFYHAMWGFRDGDEVIPRFNVIPKNRDLVGEIDWKNDRHFGTLNWFSDGYWNIVRRPDGELQLNDLRFGLSTDSLTSHKSYIFTFFIEKQSNGLWRARENRNPKDRDQSLSNLIERINGRK